jgi:hypothetical protein
MTKLRKRRSALVAGERLLARVYPFVMNQITSLRKRRSALVTNIRFLARVRPPKRL